MAKVKVKKEPPKRVKQALTPTPKRVKQEPASLEEEEEEYKWWLQEERDDSVKWTSLEHNGVLFPPDYIPHGIKLVYDNSPIDLVPEAEEVAGFFGQLLGTDYAKNDVFCRNFFEDFVHVLDECQPNHPIQEFEKCNFDLIFQYYEQLKERRKNRTKAEKDAEKVEKKIVEDKYSWALLDGRREKVGSYRIEPPGLFRGRGDHPKTGRLKKRVMPEQITLNLSEQAPIPEPPAGHAWGAIVHDNKVTWLATWKENVNQSVKYVFLAATSSLKGQSDFKKFEKARQLTQHIASIRETYTADLRHKQMEVRQRATAMYLIDRFALRAGNEKGDDEADTVGCCSLRLEHITCQEPNIVVFDFLGKDSVRYYNQVEVDQQVWKNLVLFKKPPKKESDLLFDRLSTSVLNKHLSGLMPGLTAKVFRTFNASWTMQQELKKTPLNLTPKELELFYNRCNRQVAILCNHQRNVSNSHGNAMEKLQERIRALKFERYNVRLQYISEYPDETQVEVESDLEDDWKHELLLIQEMRDKDQKKREKAQLLEEDKKAKALAACDKAQEETDRLEKEFTERQSRGHVVQVMPAGTSAERYKKKLAMCDDKIARMKLTALDKEENKSIALGTSKINYIDPRITVAWQKKHGLKKQLFSKSLIDKFKWAMDIDDAWDF
jgi:DNA topoisomerase-1